MRENSWRKTFVKVISGRFGAVFWGLFLLFWFHKFERNFTEKRLLMPTWKHSETSSSPSLPTSKHFSSHSTFFFRANDANDTKYRWKMYKAQIHKVFSVFYSWLTVRNENANREKKCNCKRISQSFNSLIQFNKLICDARKICHFGCGNFRFWMIFCV